MDYGLADSIAKNAGFSNYELKLHKYFEFL